jgi:hypothetical protein
MKLANVCVVMGIAAAVPTIFSIGRTAPYNYGSQTLDFPLQHGVSALCFAIFSTRAVREPDLLHFVLGLPCLIFKWRVRHFYFVAPDLRCKIINWFLQLNL